MSSIPLLALMLAPAPALTAQEALANYRTRFKSTSEIACPSPSRPDEIVVCARPNAPDPHRLPLYEPDPGRRIAGDVAPPSAGGLERCTNVGVTTGCSGGLPIPSILMAIVKGISNAIENSD